MGIPLRIVDRFSDREPGAMWRYERGDAEGRECWWVVLPNTRLPLADALRLEREAHIDSGYSGPTEIAWRTTDRAYDPPHAMWEVSGTPPLITVTPSIDVMCLLPDGTRDGSYWHGFITNGEIVG